MWAIAFPIKIKRKKYQNSDLFDLPPKSKYLLKALFIAKFIGIKPKLTLRARNQIEVVKTHGDNRKILKFLKYKIKKNIYLELPKIIAWYKQNKIWNYKV